MLKVPTQEIHLPLLQDRKIGLYIKREDLLHPLISGNKHRKLKYNIITAKNSGHTTLLTFGGAFSNHIAATAYAGKLHGFSTIGVIRGEELSESWHQNPTLKLAYEHGMRFHFVSREAYRRKEDNHLLNELEEKFGPYYLLPEGGTNAMAIKGCEEIVTEADSRFDFICAAVGTGGTLAGIINASYQDQHVLGFPALKGDFLKEDIRNFVSKENWELKMAYHFGGYAKVDQELIQFLNDFKKTTQIPLDPIYTGKMIFGLLHMVENYEFEPKTKLLAIHTGGLQGCVGMNMKLKKKNLPLLDL